MYDSVFFRVYYEDESYSGSVYEAAKRKLNVMHVVYSRAHGSCNG